MEQKVTKFIANFYLCSIRKNPPKNGAKSHQILCKHKIFFTWVYMIFKYSKRFRFAPSFNEFSFISTSTMFYVFIKLIYWEESINNLKNFPLLIDAFKKWDIKKSCFEKIRWFKFAKSESSIFWHNWPLGKFKDQTNKLHIIPKRIWYKVVHTIG